MLGVFSRVLLPFHSITLRGREGGGIRRHQRRGPQVLRRPLQGPGYGGGDQPRQGAQARNGVSDIKFVSHSSFPGSGRQNLLLLLVSIGSTPKDSTQHPRTHRGRHHPGPKGERLVRSCHGVCKVFAHLNQGEMVLPHG